MRNAIRMMPSGMLTPRAILVVLEVWWLVSLPMLPFAVSADGSGEVGAAVFTGVEAVVLNVRPVTDASDHSVAVAPEGSSEDSLEVLASSDSSDARMELASGPDAADATTELIDRARELADAASAEPKAVWTTEITDEPREFASETIAETSIRSSSRAGVDMVVPSARQR